MRQKMLMAVLIGLVVILGGIAYLSAAESSNARPKSYREAVERVLNAQRVDYRDIEVIDSCAPSYQFCHFYSGKVRIVAVNIMSGQIDCRERWITCTITIPQAGIIGAALEDTLDPLQARWDDYYGQLLLWLRSASRGFAQSD